MSEKISDTPRHNAIHILAGIVVLLLLSGLAILTLWGAWKAVVSLLSVDDEIAKAIIVASISGIISVIGVVYAKWNDRKRAIEEALREKKSQIYEDFLKFWIGAMMKDAVENPGDHQENTIEFMNDNTHKIVVWASDDVLKEYSDFRENSLNSIVDGKLSNPRKTMRELEGLFKTVRRDLGHKNKRLKDGDILALFINDVRKHFAR